MPLGLFPLPPQDKLEDLFTRLVAALSAHGYEHTTSLPEPGRLYHLMREPETLSRFLRSDNNAYESSALAAVYRRAFGRSRPEAITLYEVFHLQRRAPRATLEALLGKPLVDDLVAAEILLDDLTGMVARVRATGMAPLIQIHDTSSIHAYEKDRFVFCGRCSSRLVNSVRAELRGRPDGSLGRTLDLCTGSGVQALNLHRWSREIWGGDLNPRAVAFARANARANGIQGATFVQSNLFESISGRFDLITANTPFLLLDEGSRALDGYGGAYGMEVELRLIEGLPDHLEPRGVAQLVVSSAFVGGENLLKSRLESMFAAGGWEIDLFPISQYYSTEHWRAYERVQVEKCVLYIMRAERVDGAPLQVRAHDWPAGMRQILEAKVKVERQIARRKHIKKHGTDAIA